MPEKIRIPIFRIVSVYLAFSVLYIFFSDRALELLTNDIDQLTVWQTYKGIFFVISSGFLIYLLLRRELKQRETTWVHHQKERELLMEQIRQSNDEIRDAYDDTIQGWARTLEMRDRETRGHSDRVVELTLSIARAMGFPEEELQYIRWGALLHDLGKMGIPDHILSKPGALTDEERAIIKLHPQYGYDLLKDIQYLSLSLDIPHYHHERWDGTGYPFGIAGEEIPLTARIFAVVDVWDAMTSERPYHPPLTTEETIKYILTESGRHFDPVVVGKFMHILNSRDEPQPKTNSR